MNADTYAADFLTDLRQADEISPRHAQSDARVLGFSDIGGCEERYRRFLAGEPFTDTPEKMAAWVGTWVDTGIKQVRQRANPHLLMDVRVQATLPSGLRIPGHPDEINPDTPLVIDYKTADGLAAVRRLGPSTKHRIQRALQYLACLQSGVFTSEDGYVGNLYLDRSGNDTDVHVDLRPWREERDWIEYADQWYLRVLRHVQKGTPADRTEHLPICRRYCPFFSACRGADQQSDEPLDGTVAELAALYAEADSKEKQAKALKEALRADLLGLTGRTSTHHVRTSSDGKLTVSVLRNADVPV